MGSPVPERIRRTARVLAGWVLAASDYTDSTLHDAGHFHLLRPKKKRRRADPEESRASLVSSMPEFSSASEAACLPLLTYSCVVAVQSKFDTRASRSTLTTPP